MNIKELDKKYVADTYARFPIELVKGEGSKLYDDTGKEYIDMGTGIGVNIFGVGDKEWISAVTNQLNTLQHASNRYYTEPCVNLAKILCEKTGAQKVFFSNSGAEANECAIKCARKYAAEKKGAEYFNIITLNNSFHGRTVTTLAATGQESFHKDFLPLTEGFLYADAGDFDGVKALIENNKVAAIMLEVVQGEGGVVPLEVDFVKNVAELCKTEDILLVVDEVQTGNGRTGALYGYMKYDICPDIVSTAKGLGGGLPIGATMFFEKTSNVYVPGTHGSTFGGNPVSCAGAYNIISRLDDDFLKSVEEKHDYIIKELKTARVLKVLRDLALCLVLKLRVTLPQFLKNVRRMAFFP